MKRKAKIYASRELRKNQTDVEQVLWEELRRKSLDGIKFRRQHIVKGFVVDFYCPEVKLAIELDGGIHMKRKFEDRQRQSILESEGISVIRFKNKQVLHNIEDVMNIIRSNIECKLLIK